jgi:hypothetical protein
LGRFPNLADQREGGVTTRPRLRTLTLGGVLAVIVPIANLSGQATDPAAGTWELNLEKSKFSPGPPPKSLTRTYEVTRAGVKYTAKGIDADGKPTLVQFTAKYDGKDYPVTGSPDFDAISLKRIDAFKSEATLKKAGKVVQTITRVVSQDSETLTLTVKGTNAKGQTVNDVLVFDKY